MNAEALKKRSNSAKRSIGAEAERFSGTRGATSGLVQKVKQLLIDDDQDTVWLRVDVQGGASCHVGYRSCFYRSVPVGPAAQQGLNLSFHRNGKGV